MKLRCKCGKVLRVGDESAGKIITCPECKALLRVPGPTGGSGAPPVNATQPGSTERLSTEDLDLTDGESPSELIDFQSALSELQMSEAELMNVVERGDLSVIRSGGKPKFNSSDIYKFKKNRETAPTIDLPSSGAAPPDRVEQLDTEDLVLTDGEDDRTSETIVDDFDPMSEMIEDERTEATPSLQSEPQDDFPETPIESLKARRGGLAVPRLVLLVFLGSLGLNGVFTCQWYTNEKEPVPSSTVGSRASDDDHVSDSKGRIEKLQQQVAGLTDRNTALQQKLDQVKASAQKFAELVEANKRLQERLEATEAASVAADTDALDALTKIKDQEILELRVSFKKTEDELRDMKSQSELAKVRHRMLTGNFEKFRAEQAKELRKFTQRQWRLEKKIGALEQDLTGKEQKIKTGVQYWEVDKKIRMNPNDPQMRIDALSELVEGSAESWLGPVIHYRLACAYSLRAPSWPRTQKDKRAEDVKTALDHLEIALETGFYHIDHMKRDSDLRTIRQESRYTELLASIERPNAEQDKEASEEADSDQDAQ